MRQKKIGISPKTIHKPFGNYSHGILNSKNGLLMTSGQLGINLDGSIPTSFSEQTNICFSNIFSIIKEAKLDLEDILRLNTYLTDRQNLDEYMKIRDRFFSNVSVHKLFKFSTIKTTLLLPRFKTELTNFPFFPKLHV